MLNKSFPIYFVLFFLIYGCQKNDEGFDPHLINDPTLVVGKWKIRRPSSDKKESFNKSACNINTLIFNVNGQFKIYTDTGLIVGNYLVAGENSIALFSNNNNIGQIINIILVGAIFRLTLHWMIDAVKASMERLTIHMTLQKQLFQTIILSKPCRFIIG